MQLESYGLNKIERARMEAGVTIESMDPPFPYVTLTGIPDVGNFGSPMGFPHSFFGAEFSLPDPENSDG